MVRHSLNFIPVIGSLLLIWGCEPTTPGSPLPNLPPDTRVIVAPMPSDTADHYVSPSSMFWVQWFGHDPDGLVAGYWVQVDDGSPVYTTKGDSAMSFVSSERDSANPALTLPTPHRLRVTAVDNEGLRDPTPAERTFNVVNAVPSIRRFIATFADSALVGPGIAFEVQYRDPNPSGARFRVSIDDNPIMDWDARSKFQFCDVNDPSILASLKQGEVRALDAGLLTPGMHLLKVEMKDLGDALSDPVQRTITVADTFSPVISNVSSKYGAADYYIDGTIFHQPNTVTSFTITGSAAGYNGGIANYRYRLFAEGADEQPWSAWGEGKAELRNMQPGWYVFQALCRDWTGRESEVRSSSLGIVQSDFSAKKLLVIDETRTGNGGPGSPDDRQCDNFYRAILEMTAGEIDPETGDTLTWARPDGWSVTELDVNTHIINDVAYISAGDVYDKRVILWHGDDRSKVLLANYLPILQQYLDRGGRLIVSGWNVMAAFTQADSAAFTSGFAYKYLRISNAVRGMVKSFVGMTGALGFGDLNLDRNPDRFPQVWNGLDFCWALYPRHRSEAIGAWMDFDAGSSFQGRDACIRNFSPAVNWRTVTLGFPLYFMIEAEARAFISKVIDEVAE